VVSLPALRLIARAYPDAERWMLTNFSVGAKMASASEVLDGTGLVHDYIKYPTGTRDLNVLNSLRQQISGQMFDTLIYLNASRGRATAVRDALFFKSCGVRSLLGVPYKKRLQENLLLEDGLYEYEGARLLRCLNDLGEQSLESPDSFDLCLAENERDAASRALEGVDSRSPIVAVSIGTKLDVNDWGDDKWGRLLAIVGAGRPDAQLVILGVQVERQRSQNLASHWPSESLNLCGLLRVRETAAVLARADLFVGHDSGLMHFAAAVGTPVVAVFSSRNPPGQWFPHGTEHRVLYTRIDCQGCRRELCIDRQKQCIRSIGVEAVAAAVLEKLL